MKYGQQYAEALSASSEEFQQASIDYKQLKKSIKRIEKELNALGLNAQVLRELLSGGDLGTADDNVVQQPKDHVATTQQAHGKPPSLRKSGSTRSLSVNIASSPAIPLSPTKSRHRKRRQARARAEYELAGTVENPIPRIKLVFSSESSGSEGSSLDGEHSLRDDDLYNRLLRADSAKIVELSDSDEPTSRSRGFEGKGKQSRSQSESSEIFDSKEVSSEDQDPQSSTSHTDDDDRDKDGFSSNTDKLIDKMYGHGLVPASQVTPPGSPATIRPPASNGHPSYFQNSNMLPDEEGNVVVQGPQLLLRDLTLAESAEQDRIAEAEEADEESDGTVLKKAPSIKSNSSRKRLHSDITTANVTSGISSNGTRRRGRRHRREVVINLEYDSEFFAMLNSALSSLTELMNAEKASFMAAVKELAAIVKNTATPAKNKRDLYAWREVFSLWVEAEIFEGEREKDRGERVVQEIERRLNWFVDQVGRRKLAKKMKSKESRRALERFVELNQELLQLKRIGIANQEAARKILKKHDKRLGLSASQDFPDFVAQHNQLLNAGGEASGKNKPGEGSQALLALRSRNALIGQSALAKTATSNEMSSLIFVGLTTLPHALLTMFTDILLPIIPQIDDYSCIICGDIAWRPIALDCGHRFCVRCLVKMQKRGQDACPACRAPVVLKASKENLDAALMAYQRMWFPLEIKQKQRDDTKEIEREYAEEMHLSGSGKCIIA